MTYKKTGEASRDEHAVIGGVAGKKVFVIDASGNQITDFGGATQVQTLLDDVTTTSMTYVGTAPIGTATSAGAWTIKRIDESGTPTTLVVKWATGGASTCIWNDRAALTYS